MSVFLLVTLLVTAGVIANIVYDIFPRIPLAFYQIGAGLILSLVPSFADFQLEPELFMLLIIAPLMFNDGQTTDAAVLRRNLGSTLSLAVLLAAISILLGGFLAHSLWLAIPLPLAFALSAIVTPTDAVAVKSITSDLEVPENVMGSLENESLFNDASGLVGLSLALTAFTTGHFSFGESVMQFLIVFFGGILVGLVLGMLIVTIRQSFQRKSMNAIAVDLPINIMTPFLVYLAAEELGLSGILAVVAAGIVHGMQGRRLRLTSTQTQIVTRSTWGILTGLLNGFVFVLLGTVMPQVWQNLTSDDASHMSQLVAISVGLYVLMLVLRFFWSGTRFVDLRSLDGQAIKDQAILAISGVHGTITLAMAFSLPLTMNGHGFPFRTALIFIAGTVILLSLLVPTIVLPFMVPKKQASFTESELETAVSDMVGFAVDQLRTTTNNHTVLAPVIETLNSQKGEHVVSDERTVHQLLEKTSEVESAAISDMIDSGEADPVFGWKYNRMQTLQVQMAFLSPVARLKMWTKLVSMRFFPKHAHKKFKKFFQDPANKDAMVWPQDSEPNPNTPATRPGNYQLSVQTEQLLSDLPAEVRNDPRKWTHQQMREVHRKMKDPKFIEAKRRVMAEMETKGFDAVMKYLNAIETPDNRAEVNVVRHYYSVRHSRLSHEEVSNDQSDQLFIQAFQYEYAYVQRGANNQELSSDLASELQTKISLDQLVYMQGINS